MDSRSSSEDTEKRSGSLRAEEKKKLGKRIQGKNLGGRGKFSGWGKRTKGEKSEEGNALGPAEV